MEIKHPAKFSSDILLVIAKYSIGYKNLLDPFAGTGRIAKIKENGFSGRITCIEIEPEWVSVCKREAYPVDCLICGDSREELKKFDDGYFDIIATSPTYGNRMADAYNPKDKTERITYTHSLRRPLSSGNTGAFQWGKKYIDLHEKIYAECARVLSVDGRIILNVSNHIRNWSVVNVIDWHKQAIESLGFSLSSQITIETRRMRKGKNGSLRIPSEDVLVFDRKGMTRKNEISCWGTN